MGNAKWEMGLAGTRLPTVRWRHGLRRSVPRVVYPAGLRRLDGALYVIECAMQTLGYAALTLGAAWLLWRFVP
jgi:hypothetical protein